VLGRMIRLAGQNRQIVGVVGTVQQAGAGFFLTGMTKGPLTDPPQVYVPATQAGTIFKTHMWFQPVWTVRSPSMSVAEPAIRRAIASVDPLLPVAAPESMAAVMADSTAAQRLLMTLVGMLAGAAILLAALGIHGLIAHTIAERTREFGIRLALGSTAAQAMRTAALPGILLSIAGAVIGGGLSVLAVRLVQKMLWRVTMHDPMTYAAVGIFLMIVAAVASTMPALKILRLNPARTLRD
jgi:ABC-type antimicrobial peptide transport system permease subunit